MSSYLRSGQEFPLNSNLILLILRPIPGKNNADIRFKFQSDSINTVASSSQTSVSFPLFKFQSDSINTEERSHNKGKNLTLNSNLILLIHVFTLKYKDRMYFKFQSDSINTHTFFTVLLFQAALNSNLILLIHKFNGNEGIAVSYFKFQSDSINTGTRGTVPRRPVSFKFQSDSINTSYQKRSYSVPSKL